MNFITDNIRLLGVLSLSLFLYAGGLAVPSLAQEKLPVREYTNPEEIITFDRSTDFTRALDVINEFSQEYTGKIILDRTNTGGPIEVGIPPMHWRDALDMILRVKNLRLVERRDYFEIISPEPEVRTSQAQQGGGGQQQTDLIATTATREVRINAIFFEGNRRALKEIGVDWSTLSQDVPSNLQDFVGTEGSERLPSQGSGFSDQFVSVNQIGAQNVSQNVFNALVNIGELGTSGIEVQALFSAFEADNLGEVIASPTVKVMDGVEGRIQVGEDFSIKQRDFAGNVIDNFVSTGTILTVTPTLIEQRDTTFIHLNITAEKSSAQPDPVSTIISKQTAETQTLLLDGEATAIAGLYSTETAEVRRGVPILKDLPGWFFGLRYLFGYNSKDYQMSELVILVQADLVPSIPERVGTKKINKFDLLNEQRLEFREDMKDRETYSPSLDIEDLNNDEKKLKRNSKNDEEANEQEDEKPEPVEEPKNQEKKPEENQEEEQDSEEAENKPEQQQNQQKIDEPEVVDDPELDVKPVQIDLGEEEEEDKTEQEEEMTDAAEDRQSTTDQQQEGEDQQHTPSGSFNFYVIAGSFTVQENAVKFKNDLVKNGFDDAVILTNPESIYQLVAYGGYNNREVASASLADIRQYYNSEAWLYEAEN